MYLLLINFICLLLLCSCAASTPQMEQDLTSAPVVRDKLSRSLYLVSRARLALHEGDYPTALNLLRDAIEVDPESAMLHGEMAELKLKIGQVPEALDYIKKAIKLDPAYRPPYALGGILMGSTGKDLEAATYLRTAIKLDPSKEGAYLQSDEAVP